MAIQDPNRVVGSLRLITSRAAEVMNGPLRDMTASKLDKARQIASVIKRHCGWPANGKRLSIVKNNSVLFLHSHPRLFGESKKYKYCTLLCHSASHSSRGALILPLIFIALRKQISNWKIGKLLLCAKLNGLDSRDFLARAPPVAAFSLLRPRSLTFVCQPLYLNAEIYEFLFCVFPAYNFTFLRACSNSAEDYILGNV